jgi:predicted ATPase
MARRLSSPVFIGRSRELQTLLSTADVAASGGASLALVGGEAGVGKSRLVAEAAARLGDRDWLVLEGGSVALGDDGLPFGPIVEALRALARDVDTARIAAAAGPSLAELARLVPELSGVVADGAVTAGQADWLQIRSRGSSAAPDSARRPPSCLSSRTCTGRTARPVTCWRSWPATRVTSVCSSSPPSGPMSCTGVIR